MAIHWKRLREYGCFVGVDRGPADENRPTKLWYAPVDGLAREPRPDEVTLLEDGDNVCIHFLFTVNSVLGTDFGTADFPKSLGQSCSHPALTRVRLRLTASMYVQTHGDAMENARRRFNGFLAEVMPPAYYGIAIQERGESPETCRLGVARGGPKVVRSWRDGDAEMSPQRDDLRDLDELLRSYSAADVLDALGNLIALHGIAQPAFERAAEVVFAAARDVQRIAREVESDAAESVTGGDK